MLNRGNTQDFQRAEIPKAFYTCKLHVNYMLENRVKIDVYISREHKKEILKRAKLLGLSVSDYMKLKALDMLKDENKKRK